MWAGPQTEAWEPWRERGRISGVSLGAAVRTRGSTSGQGPAAGPLAAGHNRCAYVSGRHFSALESLCWGWGRRRKPPGVALGKSLRHSLETWTFLVLTISYPTATSEPRRAGQASQPPRRGPWGTETWRGMGTPGPALRSLKVRGQVLQVWPRCPQCGLQGLCCLPSVRVPEGGAHEAERGKG